MMSASAAELRCRAPANARFRGVVRRAQTARQDRQRAEAVMSGLTSSGCNAAAKGKFYLLCWPSHFVGRRLNRSGKPRVGRLCGFRGNAIELWAQVATARQAQGRARGWCACRSTRGVPKLRQPDAILRTIDVHVQAVRAGNYGSRGAGDNGYAERVTSRGSSILCHMPCQPSRCLRCSEWRSACPPIRTGRPLRSEMASELSSLFH
jgi:hypothetical protein